MAQLPNVFKAEDNRSAFEPLPDGWYTGVIKKSELKTSAAGGKYISFGISVEDQNTMIWVNLNIVHPNPKAVKMAQVELSRICDACGVEEIEDTSELHDIPIGILVYTQEGNPPYGPRNAIKQYVPVDEIPEDNSNPF